MSKYIIRLDDATIRMDILKWEKMEKLLDKYNIKPLVGIIPDCKDPMMRKYDYDPEFWIKAKKWQEKEWSIAMHGYDHVYITKNCGINPVNNRSEFAGLDLETQRVKIKNGVQILEKHGIQPVAFFAPSHTFDENTIIALKEESNIRIISDTIANDAYVKYGITFVPQQSGKVRYLPFRLVTFCYHPNTMTELDFCNLERFIKANRKRFISFPREFAYRKISGLDKFLQFLYFIRRQK